MAALNNNELAKIRNVVAKGQSNVGWNKGDINSASQAVEDWMIANVSDLLIAIDTATSPFVFSSGDKKKIIKQRLMDKVF